MMNRVLVAVEPKHPSVSAAVYAFNLAERIQAKIFFLMIDNHAATPAEAARHGEGESAWQEELRSLLSSGNGREGVRVGFYVASGPYESELVSFIRQNRISLLVVGFPAADQQEATGLFLERLMRIKQKINCRVVIVSEKMSGTS
jgi:K+-sensing histidine kinase KdpD